MPNILDHSFPPHTRAWAHMRPLQTWLLTISQILIFTFFISFFIFLPISNAAL